MEEIKFERRGPLMSKEEIMDIRDQLKEATAKYGGRGLMFDPNKLLTVDDDIFVSFRKELEAVERRYRDNVQLYVICEMALLYLDHVDNERAVKED